MAVDTNTYLAWLSTLARWCASAGEGGGAGLMRARRPQPGAATNDTHYGCGYQHVPGLVEHVGEVVRERGRGRRRGADARAQAAARRRHERHALWLWIPTRTWPG
ncbi:unnamed protein product [Arctia plantaginis]|uniref:Uncharacterized protein n=1 Tax=Arctia plantaginis TaxID=874455 RepID=A0A8S1BC38_ARCPL|nr:unnamed protein product [Arctia plantaginis]CAB3254463.1 unnamed protein product [Arctia plantaginis]